MKQTGNRSDPVGLCCRKTVVIHPPEAHPERWILRREAQPGFCTRKKARSLFGDVAPSLEDANNSVLRHFWFGLGTVLFCWRGLFEGNMAPEAEKPFAREQRPCPALSCRWQRSPGQGQRRGLRTEKRRGEKDGGKKQRVSNRLPAGKAALLRKKPPWAAGVRSPCKEQLPLLCGGHPGTDAPPDGCTQTRTHTSVAPPHIPPKSKYILILTRNTNFKKCHQLGFESQLPRAEALQQVLLVRRACETLFCSSSVCSAGESHPWKQSSNGRARQYC